MSRGSYRLLALLTLPLPLLAAHLSYDAIPEWLPEDVLVPAALLRILGYLLLVLLFVLIWASLLAPLRRRAGFRTLAEQLSDRNLSTAVARAQVAQKERASSSDPKVRAEHHFTFALVSGLMGIAAVGIGYALWQEGYVMAFAIAGILVCPPLALYHGVQWLRALSASRPRS